jgi:YHS domain-containing protein
MLGVAIFAALFRLTARRGATDPVCGMTVDRDRAITRDVGGERLFFCSAHCLHAYESAHHHAASGTSSPTGTT